MVFFIIFFWGFRGLRRREGCVFVSFFSLEQAFLSNPLIMDFTIMIKQFLEELVPIFVCKLLMLTLNKNKKQKMKP